MKTGRTLPDLAAELYRQADAKRDFLAPAEDLKIRSNGHTNLLVNGAYSLNEIAHGQMADYTGIPRAFYERLRTHADDLRIHLHNGALPPPCWHHGGEHSCDAPQEAGMKDSPLFDVVVNRLLQSKGKDGRLVRTLDGTARAFLSENFNVDLDNFDVFRVAAKVIEEAGLEPDNVVSAEVTERKLYLKVVSPKLEAVVHPNNIQAGHPYLKEPQAVQAGFILMNSETGLGSLCVQQIVMKLMCTNLWIKEDAYRQRHIGRALEADGEGIVYQSDTRAAEAKARLLKVRDHVNEALNEQKFRMFVAQMQGATEIRLESGVERVIETTARKFGLNQTEKEAVMQHLIEGADLSLWGLSNAVTAMASSVPSYDRATELEAIGGRLLSLPTTELTEIARAA